MLTPAYLSSLLENLLKFLENLGPEILVLYSQADPVVHTKSDNTPVTQTDLFSHQAIVNFLKNITPDIPVISEEENNNSIHINTNLFWLVDPLDGTKEFIAKTDDFSINLALIENNKPILGIIYAPVFNLFYYSIYKQGAYKKLNNNPPEKMHTHPLPKNKPVIIASRRHAENKLLQDFFAKYPNHTLLSRGSAIKFGLIAEGIADIYPRFGETYYWDTAAGQCIVQEAGGKVVDTNGQPLRYNAERPYLNPFFIAVGGDKP